MSQIMPSVRKPALLAFIFVSLTSNALGIALPILLASSLAAKEFGEFSWGMLLGGVGFAVASYGFENTLLRVAASTNSALNLLASWMIRGVLLIALCAAALLALENSLLVLVGAWVASASLLNRGSYDFENRQLTFATYIFVDRAIAILLAILHHLHIIESAFVLAALLVSVRLGIVATSSMNVWRARSSFGVLWKSINELLVSNSPQALTATLLVGVSSGAPLLLGLILEKESVAKYFFIYQFGYLTPVLYGYLSRFLYVQMYKPGFVFQVELRRIRPKLAAFLLLSSFFVYAAFYTAEKSGIFEPEYFDYKLLLIFILWNGVFVYGAYVSAYLLSIRLDSVILRANILALPVLLVSSVLLITLAGARGAAIAMALSHAMVVALYIKGVGTIEANSG